jgi:hypothetical protein
MRKAFDQAAEEAEKANLPDDLKERQSRLEKALAAQTRGEQLAAPRGRAPPQ